MIPLLGPLSPFPPPENAPAEFDGLVAAGADLSPGRLLAAYRQGIFPWGTLEGLPLWYSPDPRMVLFPEEFRLHRSLLKTLRRSDYEIRLDTAFPAVIAACAATPRRGQDGTWITPEMQMAYILMHELGWAHSVETWVDGELVGGLYGIAIGRAFFGESMFAHRTDASKIAFAHLHVFLREREFGMIDCQMHTPHLASLGARAIARREFAAHLARLTAHGDTPGRWPATAAQRQWQS